MEVYHSRFTHGGIDDAQLQAEFRVSELGPPLGEYAKFKDRGKVLTKKLKEKPQFPWNG